MINAQKIREKLAELRRRDRHYELFGASAHRYELNPRLTEEDVSAFEGRYRCRFP